MKPKLARRFLTRNRWKIKKKELNETKLTKLFDYKYKPKSFIRKCLKALRQNIKLNRNPASIRVYNNFMYR